MPERDVTREKTSHQPDKTPDDDRVPFEGEGRTVDRDDHWICTPLQANEGVMGKTPSCAKPAYLSFEPRSPSTAPSTRLNAGKGWMTSASSFTGVPTFTASTSSPRISPARGVTKVAPTKTPRPRSATSLIAPPWKSWMYPRAVSAGSTPATTTSTPRAAAAASDNPTDATSGSVNVTRGTAVWSARASSPRSRRAV